MRFQYEIFHSPGKSLYLADTLSRAPLCTGIEEVDSIAEQEVEDFANGIIAAIPASPDRLDTYREAQHKDHVCSQLIEFCKSGWPSQHSLSGEIKKYWHVRHELTLNTDLLLYRSRIIIPAKLRKETLEKVHQGHQGILRCRMRVSASVWWPGVSSEVEDFVKSCPECMKSTAPPREPMLPSTLPSHPWEKVASDLFELKKENYLLVVDYFSRYVEVQKLNSTTAGNIVKGLKSIFARHGIPSLLVSDNGPQYDCREMKEFAEKYGFQHVTSSPHYPQANGQAERAVKTVKQILENSTDQYMALLSYRSTPLPSCGLSPAELLMGRRIKTDVPQMKKLLIPDWPYLEEFRQIDSQNKQEQKRNYDRRHRVRSLPTLPNDLQVWADTPTGQEPGTIIQPSDTPRSYRVAVPSGEVRRTRTHLRPRSGNLTTETPTNTPKVIETRSRTGTTLNRPNYLSY